MQGCDGGEPDLSGPLQWLPECGVGAVRFVHGTASACGAKPVLAHCGCVVPRGPQSAKPCFFIKLLQVQKSSVTVTLIYSNKPVLFFYPCTFFPPVCMFVLSRRIKMRLSCSTHLYVKSNVKNSKTKVSCRRNPGNIIIIIIIIVIAFFQNPYTSSSNHIKLRHNIAVAVATLAS